MASDLSLEKNLQTDFKASRKALTEIEQALVSSHSYQEPLAELKTLGESIRTNHQDLLARLNARGERLGELGANAVTRHAAVLQRYEQSISRYLIQLNALEDQVTLSEVLQIKEILKDILPKRKLRIHGSIPYRHLNLPARPPLYTPEIIPAYKGGEQNFAGADLDSSPEAQVSLAIAKLAESLNWNPVEMYEWVKNNIQTEWYWGCMKGAEETLRQMSGNDADQAALLVAMFRSAGFPARYVRGVMEFFPDIESVREQIGLDEPLAIARFFQKAGIPYETVIAGGGISNFRIEHIWVEVEIPYDNYRGAVIDEHGRTWLALDTSIKAGGYITNTPGVSLQTIDLSEIRQNYLGDFKTATPLEYLEGQINDQLSNQTYDDLLFSRSINQEHLKIIPAGLQFAEVAVTGEYASLPDELLHMTRFTATSLDGSVFFAQSLPVYALSNTSIALTFEPETIEDQEIMNACGGLDNTPLYLIHLRPLITVDGARVIVGQGGLAAGMDFSLAVELIAPSVTERVANVMVAGYPVVIGLSAQQAIIPKAIPLEAKNAERLLFERAMSYIDRGNKAEEELASLFQMRISRPLPTVVTLGGVLDVVTLLDSPCEFTWEGVYLDADLRVVETLGGVSPSGIDPRALFMQMASLQNSLLESRIFADGFGVDSVSTAKLIALANEGKIPDLRIDTANVETDLPPLGLPESIEDDIANAVNGGYAVTLPETELLYADWTGFAYIKENPATYESGWMLSGEIAGGMTALNPDSWPEDYYDILANPMVESTDNPLSAIEIRVIKGFDILAGTVGQQLENPLQVIALDRDGKRVKGVEVVFDVRAGGGKVRNNQISGSTWQSKVSVATGYDGIAGVDLLFGESTKVNPTTAKRATDGAVQRVDETVIEVTTTSGIQAAAPISLYGFPDAPHHLRVEGGNSTGNILSWGATLVTYVEDRYNNPINGQQVDFVMGNAQLNTVCSASNQDERPGLLVTADDPCMKSIPVHGECGSDAITSVTGLNLGAVVHVILGGLPDATYPVSVQSGSLASELVNVFSSSAGDCNEEDEPYSALALKVIHASDASGNIITGGAVGTTIPLYARMYYVREEGRTIEKNFSCSQDGTDTCPVFAGTGEYHTDTGLVAASVTFDGTEAANLGNGLFRVDYPLPAPAGKHEIGVTGEATETVKITADICNSDKDCQLIDFERPSPPVEHSTEVYAVDINIPQYMHIIPVNEDGYVTYDYSIEYTIEPPEYTAGTAYFVLSKEVTPGTFEKVAYFNSSTSGQDRMTFLKGFKFDQDANYIAQVVLNEGSEYMEVKSKEIKLIPLTVELDADLNNDGIFSEDDPLENIAPGLVVPLNIDDDDQDGVPDTIDGYDADNNPGNADDAMLKTDANGNAIPINDDDLVKVELKAFPSSLHEGTVVLEVIEGEDKIRIWTSEEKGRDNLLIDFSSTASVKKQWTIGPGNDLADISELLQSIYVEGVKAINATGDTSVLITKYITSQGKEIEMDRVEMTPFLAEVIPDYNRDGRIDELDRGKVNDQEPWRIWVNDDNDAAADSQGLGSENLPGQGDDLVDRIFNQYKPRVNGISDLIDFFPLYLDISKALYNWPLREGYTYNINQKDEAISIIEAEANGKILTTENANDYLEDFNVAEAFKDERVKIVGAVGYRLSDTFLNNIISDPKYGLLLIEGRAESVEPLVLEIRDQEDNLVISYSFPLEVVPVTKMYGHKNLREIAGAAESNPDRYVDFDSTTGLLKIGSNKEIGKQPFCMQGVDKSLAWVHGYNNSPTDAQAAFAEVFKRFFHAGLNGRFYGITWYGDPPALSIGPAHYHQAVVNAFATSGPYKDFIDQIPGITSIAAHSLGNMLVGSAIQDHGLSSFAKYFAIDAAVALEAYGQTVDVASLVDQYGTISSDPNADMIRVVQWPDYITAGQSRLLASEWYKLFVGENDNRKELTWRNRLGNVPSEKVYNFYSSTEEVLRRYPDDDLLEISELLGNLDQITDYLSIATWVKQEKFKGRNYFPNVGGAMSPFGGWELNRYWWIEDPNILSDPKVMIPLPPETSVYISEDTLRETPFFDLRVDELLSENPNDTAPSDFVMKLVSDTELANYYDDNEAAHELVRVRDWLLAEAFPATTLPMGANENGKLRDHNIDMSLQAPEGFKTSDDSWPREEDGEPVWYHSDYKDIPYHHVYTFYKKIKDICEN